MRIIKASHNFPGIVPILEELLPGHALTPVGEDQLVAACRSAEVLIPTMARIPAEVITGSSLKLIQQMGVGLEGVDIPAATAAGIPVCNVPADQAEANAESTSEHALFLMMAAARRLNQHQEHLAKGPWGAPVGLALYGRRALVVGLGRVGKSLARRLKAMGMRVSAVKATPAPGLAGELGLDELGGPQDFPRLLASADFVTAALTANPGTLGLFNQAAFAAMKPGAILVNVGRGGVVDEAALVAALDSGHLGGAGLDVFAAEPPARDNPLLRHPLVVATPHVAGVTEQSFAQIGRHVADNILRLERGEELKFRAN
ncbi:MAG: 2-hydroxyacid dehydrogenase [Desulfarculaceae bacterium]|nr:2-hydroxyacid dehydrogenase [Desulfarculaceae bacterium]MCF8072589.1 2-hydroxyacid dehydrogenase [Desulfarculaceae bacterium]MCF8103339.1 2-hydroxyacid dehydrogenase [Desulfarculaceae bacterium]MCF8117490.1 2-hydroxyacid dehydrogenase [Desulfarculaceae bacterium]